MRISTCLLLHLGLAALLRALPLCGADAPLQIPTAIQGEMTYRTVAQKCRCLDRDAWIDGIPNVEFQLRYHMWLLMGEPVWTFEFKYSMGREISMGAGPGGIRGICRIMSGGDSETKAAGIVKNGAGGVDLLVSDDLYRKIRFYDTFWFTLSAPHWRLGEGAVCVRSENPGSIARAEEWGWDIPSSPNWTNLFARSVAEATLSDRLDDPGRQTYHDAKAARDIWERMCLTGPSWWQSLYIHNLEIDLSYFLTELARINPKTCQAFEDALAGRTDSADKSNRDSTMAGKWRLVLSSLQKTNDYAQNLQIQLEFQEATSGVKGKAAWFGANDETGVLEEEIANGTISGQRQGREFHGTIELVGLWEGKPAPRFFHQVGNLDFRFAESDDRASGTAQLKDAGEKASNRDDYKGILVREASTNSETSSERAVLTVVRQPGAKVDLTDLRKSAKQYLTSLETGKDVESKRGDAQQIAQRILAEASSKGDGRAEKMAGRFAAFVTKTIEPEMIKGPFENTLGMKFVPVPGTKVLFCIWETRVQDYRAYAVANSGVGTSWQNPGFAQGDTHPVVNVDWTDAKAFCAWLSRKEGKTYRLPTDEEWSWAVGIGGRESGSTPEDKDQKLKDVYPWGTQYPPPAGAGNYIYYLKVDNYDRTAPVGSFTANQFGLYDLGGNVWEWCEDWYDGKQTSRVVRGASWEYSDRWRLSSSTRNGGLVHFPDYENFGFRVVLVGKAN